MIGYDLNGFGQDDLLVRMSVQDDTPFALGFGVRSNGTPSPRGGNVKSSKGVKDAREFTLSVMIYGSTDQALDARYGAFMRLVDQETLTLGRTVDGVRTVAAVKLVSVQQRPEYMPRTSIKTSVIVSLEDVYWRDPEYTIVDVPSGAFDLVELSDSTTDIPDARILVAGAAEPLTSFSITDETNGSGISWLIPGIPIGSYQGVQSMGAMNNAAQSVEGFDIDQWGRKVFAGGAGAPSSAAVIRVLSDDGTTIDFGLGNFTTLTAIACSGSLVYTLDRPGGSWRIQRWTLSAPVAPGAPPAPPPTPSTIISTNGIGAGQLFSPLCIAASAGGIVVGDGSGKISKFTTAGVYQWQAVTTNYRSVGIDPTTNQIYAAGASDVPMRRYSSTGTYDATFTAVGRYPVVDPSTSEIFATLGSSAGLVKLSIAGAILATFSSAGAGEGQINGVRGMAVTPAHTLLVRDYPNGGRVQRFDGDGIFDGIGVGQWLLIDCDTARATVVAADDFDAYGDMVTGLSTVMTLGKRYAPKSRPSFDMLAPEMPTVTSQTGGGQISIRAKKAYL